MTETTVRRLARRRGFALSKRGDTYSVVHARTGYIVVTKVDLDTIAVVLPRHRAVA